MSEAADGFTEQQWRVRRALADADKPLSVNQLAERALLAKIGRHREARYQRIEQQLGAGELARLYELLALVAGVVVDPDRGA